MVCKILKIKKMVLKIKMMDNIEELTVVSALMSQMK